MLHKKKAEAFYSRKRNSRIKASRDVEYEAVAFDFQKILPVPNITTNDVYYKRQLSVYFFNVHILSMGDSVFYCYDQTIAKRGCNDVVSMLHNFIFNVLPSTVKRLSLFCDSCAGQNKNFTMFRYLYYVVHVCKRFENVQVTFPIRGHSYMECDKNMALIPKKIPAEVPADWYQAVENCRIKPNPFQVVKCTQEMFKDWISFFNSLKIYKPKLAVPSRPIREAYFSIEKPKLMLYRLNYNGAWESTVLLQNVNRQKKTVQRATNSNSLPNGEFLLPDQPAYSSLIPVATKKWENLQEKNSFLNYNVSCILTLPPYQRQGYGRLLIDFSYLLTRVEGKIGSPEKPLSDLGLISYRSYWKDVLLNYLCKTAGTQLSVKDISQEMAIHSYDIVSTLQALGMMKYWKGKHIILRKQDVLDEYVERVKRRGPLLKEVDPTCLRWTPFIPPQSNPS